MNWFIDAAADIIPFNRTPDAPKEEAPKFSKKLAKDLKKGDVVDLYAHKRSIGTKSIILSEPDKLFIVQGITNPTPNPKKDPKLEGSMTLLLHREGGKNHVPAICLPTHVVYVINSL